MPNRTEFRQYQILGKMTYSGLPSAGKIWWVQQMSIQKKSSFYHVYYKKLILTVKWAMPSGIPLKGPFTPHCGA